MRALSESEICEGLQVGLLGLENTEATVTSEIAAAAILEDGGILTIRNVHILGTLLLAEKSVSRPLCFRNCNVEAIDAAYTTFGQSVRFISSAVGILNAQAARFETELQFEETQLKQLNVSGATFGRALVLLDCMCLQFRGASLTCSELILRDCSLDEVDINSAHAGACEILRIRGKTFLARWLQSDVVYLIYNGGFVTFERCKIENGLSTSNSQIGGLDLVGAQIGDRIVMESSSFGKINIAHATLGTLILRDARIEGDLLIATSSVGAFSCAAEVGGSFSASDCVFSGPVQILDCDVRGDCLFQRCSTVTSLTIGHESPKRPQFHSRLFMPGCRAGTQVLLAGVDVVDLCNIEALVSPDFIVTECKFSADLRFSHARISRAIQFLDVSVGRDLVAQDTSASTVDFKRLGVGGRIDMLGSAIDGVMAVHRCTSASLEMPYTNVKSALYLVQSKFSEKIDFVAAAFGELIFDLQLRRADEGFIFPRTLLLREATYRGLRAKWLSLIQCLELQRDPDWSSFREIEAYFRRGGHDDWADEVRYRGRKAVTKRFRFGSERLGQSLVGLVSGFGAKPGRLLKSAMIVFALLTAEMSVMGDVNCNPKALTQPGCSIQTLVSSSFDFVIRGDGSRFAESTKSPPRIYSAHEQLGYDAAVVLRLLLLLLSGLWVGYFTGLIRYAGGQR